MVIVTTTTKLDLYNYRIEDRPRSLRICFANIFYLFRLIL